MNIIFHSQKFRKECNNQKLLVKRHGTRRAKRIRRRLDDLRAADVLEDMRHLPGRCHELTGDRSGQLSLDLDGPYRLIFMPADDPTFLKPDGGVECINIVPLKVQR